MSLGVHMQHTLADAVFSHPDIQEVPGITAQTVLSLYDEHGTDCYVLAFNLLGNRHEAEKIVETVFTERLFVPIFEKRVQRMGNRCALLSAVYTEFQSHSSHA